MNHSRLAPAIITLLGCSTLFACDSEHDIDAEMYDALDDASDESLDLDIPPDFDSESDPDELAAVSEEQYTVSNCLIADRTHVLADKNDRGTVNLQIGPGVPWVSAYDFDVTPLAFHDELGFWQIRKTPQNTLVASDSGAGWNTVTTGTGGTFELEMLATHFNPTPGWVYDNVVSFQGNGVHCTQLIQLRIPNCTSVGWWSTNPWPTPFYDNANCYVAPIPPGQQSFVYNNSWYLMPQNGNQCAMGNFDGAHCYVGSPPGGHTAFIWSGSFYFTP